MKILRWIARILSLLVVLFFVGSLLGDRSTTVLSLLDWVKLGLWSLIMIGLLISWRWEIVGGPMVIATFLVMVILNPQILAMWAAWISPITGVLFLLCGLYAKKKAKPVQTAG